MSGLAPTREVLANGVTVIAKRTSTTPAVTLLANVRAGSVHDTADHPGLAHFVARTIDRGTDRHSADELAEELDNRGVTLSASVNRHILSLACTCLVEDVDDVLQLVGEIVMRPAFPSVEVDRRRGEIITLIRQDDDNPGVVAVEALMSMLYGMAHPYGRRLRGTVDSVERVDRRALRQFHAGYCVPTGFSLAVVGDVEPARAIDAARSVFDGWSGGTSVEVTDAPMPRTGWSPVPSRPDDEQVADRHRLRVRNDRAPGCVLSRVLVDE